MKKIVGMLLLSACCAQAEEGFGSAEAQPMRVETRSSFLGKLCHGDVAVYMPSAGQLSLDGTLLGSGSDTYAWDSTATSDGLHELRFSGVTPPLQAEVIVANHMNLLSGTLTADTTISGTTIVSEPIVVPAGITLTIESGTIFKFFNKTGITVESGGALNATGTRAQPIVFTSIIDDTYGGDTNGDGTSTIPEAGNWHQIHADGGTITMDYAQVLYCSSSENQGGLHLSSGSSLTFNNGIVAHTEYDAMRNNGGTFTANNSVFTDNSLALCPSNGHSTVNNCVIYDVATAVHGQQGTFNNCIFSRVSDAFEEFGPNSFSHCAFWNENGYGLQSINQTGGNIWSDPLFKAPDIGDFRLQTGSPCINAGDGSAAPELDYFGQPRADYPYAPNTGIASANGAVPDIGIHEIAFFPLAATELKGPHGFGAEDERMILSGQWMDFIVYFENKTNATAAAQEVWVTNPLAEHFDWSTLELGEVVFNNQTEMGLAGRSSGSMEVDQDGTDYKVKVSFALDRTAGEAQWYLRSYDPSTIDGWPAEVTAGFLPPNDENHSGEGHVAYRIKLKEDVPAGTIVTNDAVIVFDHNAPIWTWEEVGDKTPPGWFNTVVGSHWSAPEPRALSMRVMASVTHDGSPIHEAGSELAFFAGSELLGVGYLHYGAAGWYFDAMLYADTAPSGNLTIKVFDASENEEELVFDKLQFTSAAMLGSADAPQPLRLIPQIKPEAPQPTSPVGGELLERRQVALDWDDPLNNGTWFNLYLGGPNGQVLNEWTQGRPYAVPQQLAHGDYTWWIRSWNPKGMSAWSTGAAFSIKQMLPGALTLSNAAGPAERRPAFRWETPGDPGSWFNVVILRDGVEYKRFWTQNSSWTPDTDLPPGNYSWWVHPWNPDGFGDWSDAARFEIEAIVPDAPELLPPTTAQTDSTLTYSWRHDGKTRWYQFSSVYSGTEHHGQWYKADDTVNGTSASVTIAEHPWGAYNWHVRGWAPDGMGPWSSATFMLGQPIPVYATADTLIWDNDPTSGATWYQIVIEQDGAEERNRWFKVDQTTEDGANRSINLFEPLPQGPFSWRIRAWSPVHGMGPWSSTLSVRAPYLIIDLSGGPDATSYPATMLNSLPNPIPDEYRTSKLALRFIPSGTFVMGSPADELGRNSDETQHSATLKQPFYMGVFEVTQKQWAQVMGSDPSCYKGDMRPVEEVRYSDIRGAGDGAGWPAHNRVDATSFFGKLRSKTGLVLDLPTEAQWEYACRAGTTRAYNDFTKNNGEGSDCLTASYVIDTNLEPLAWYNANNDSAKHKTVGTKQPNAWGLYDMHGNVWEWCLDWYVNEPGTDGPVNNSYRLLRGGGWTGSARRCRSAARHWYYPYNRSYIMGFRACSTTPDQ